MKKFFLHGDMASRFCQEISLDVKSIREFSQAMSVLYPKFRSYFVQKSLAGVEHFFIDSKGTYYDISCMDIVLSDNTYKVISKLKGASGVADMGSTLSAMGGGFLQSAIMGFAMQKLQDKMNMVEKSGVPEYEIIQTNSYIYSSNENRMEQGTPVPVIYGQLRVGSKIINAAVENYDFDYEESKIYEQPSTTIDIKKIVNDAGSFGKHSFVKTTNFQEGNEVGSYNSSDPSKIAVNIPSNGSEAKAYNPQLGNESFNAAYQSSPSQGGERVAAGPSVGSPNVPSASSTTVRSNTSPKPYVFPPAGDLASYLRPASSADLCVERVAQESLTDDTPLAYVSKSSEMKVGSRGAYQKLESISMFKSLELISEGPIAGLAFPIEGFDQDNGYVTYPLGANAVPVGGGKFQLGPLSYSESIGHFTAKGQANSIDIEIEKAGNNTSIPNGTHNILCDGKVNTALQFGIKASKPSSTSSASIDTTLFSKKVNNQPNSTKYFNNSLTSNDYLVSSNNIFLLEEQTGRILPNTNSNGSIYRSLNSKYTSIERINGVDYTVFNLNNLASDAISLKAGFAPGEGYKKERKDYVISPYSAFPELDIQRSKIVSLGRQTRAEALDFNSVLFGATGGTDVIDGLIADFNNAGGSNLPNSSTPFSKMCRIQIDSANTTLSTNLNTSRWIKVCRIKYQRLSSNRFTSWWTNQEEDGYISISVKDFVSYRTINGTTVRNSTGGGLSGTVRNVSYHPIYSAPYTDFGTGQDGDHFVDLLAGSANLGTLCAASAAFNNSLWSSLGAFSGQTGVTANGRTTFKYVPGSGIANNGQSKIDGSFPTHMVIGGGNNLNNVMITADGSNPDDSGAFSKGLYCPLLFPRVTVFVLRKISLGFGGTYIYEFMPTIIEAVASVSADGRVNGIHLLDVPDAPVWDSIGQFTEIFPHDIANDRPVNYGTGGTIYNYQDVGFYLRIDASSAAKDIKFEINQNGTISNSFTNSNKNAALQNVYPNWRSHIVNNTPSSTSEYEEGLVFDTIDSVTAPTAAVKMFPIDTVPDSIQDPTSEATFGVNLETINLSGKRKTSLTNGALNSVTKVVTGRARSIFLSNAGAGYLPKDGTTKPGLTVTTKLYNYTWSVNAVLLTSTSDQSNIGFSPDDEFVVYGISSLIASNIIFGNLTNDQKAMFANFKAKVTVNSSGKIQTFDVIDGGTHFFEGTDIVFMDKLGQIYQGHDDPNWLKPTYHASSVTLGTRGEALGSVKLDNGSQKLNPGAGSGSLPKRDMIISYEANHVVNGKITKFYIKDSGSGFLANQVITNPFESISFIPPTLSLTFSNGALTQARINRGVDVSGYTVNDNDVLLKVSTSAPARTTAAPPNDVTSDPSAAFRSIYLNDVPIKDANDRFNYSKYHFDMRIGNNKNGNPSSTHINPTRIASDARGHMITDEFKVPAHTKFINYPLYGPNNHDTRDYFYTHTIKNPEITSLAIAIQINKLHYVYEGDEEMVFINLIPIMGAVAGYMAGTAAAKTIIAKIAAEDPTKTVGSGKGGVGPCGGPITTATTSAGTSSPKVSTGLEMAANAAQYGAIVSGGFLGSLGGMMIASVFSCSNFEWLCFKVGAMIKNSGEIWPAKLRIGIEYGVEGEAMKEDIIEFRGCATSPYVKDIYLHTLPPAEVGTAAENKKNRIVKIYRYSREMNPVVGGLAEARYQIDAELQSITEHVGGFFSYPNSAIIGTRVNSKDHPDVPTREYLIKGRLVKVPSNYFPEQPFDAVKRAGKTKQEIEALRYSPDVWDGTFRSESDARWTSNPAWIIYDLLINERYGMGKYGIKEEDLDKWSFYEFAKYCDEEVDVFIDGTASTERRHMCNLYIDGERQAYEYIQELMQIYSCTFSFSSGKIYITVDKQDNNAVMLFNNSNVSEEGFSYSTTPETTRITACTVDYLDERDNYLVKTEYVEDAEGIRKYGYNHTKIAGTGITRLGEAHRLCWQKILTKQMEKEMIQFKTGIQAAYLRAGDIIDIMDNTKISQHSGGRISKVISSNQIEIDIPATALAGATSIYIQKAAESDDPLDTSNSDETDDRRASQFEEFSITGTVGFVVTVGGTLTDVHKGFSWMITEHASEKIKPKKFKVKNIRESSNLQYEVVGTEYVEQKYEQVTKSTSSEDGADQERDYYGHDIIVP